MKKKILITNVAYGDAANGNVYLDIFLNLHLKTMLDPTNLVACWPDIEYVVFTDSASAERIEAHENWQKLTALGIKTDMVERLPMYYDQRYSILELQLNETIRMGIERDCFVSPMVADMVVAKGYLSKMFNRLEEGHDAVFVQPPRATLEAAGGPLREEEGAPEPLGLFWLMYENMHPLWRHCHWKSPQFTQLPYSLIWNSGRGLLVRSFAITPIVFTPDEEMIGSKMIDVDVPRFLKNPYWAEDWIECPVIGVEPLFCFTSAYTNRPADPDLIGKKFCKQCIHPSQLRHLDKKLYYPHKEMCYFSTGDITYSSLIVKQIKSAFEGVK